MTTASEILEKLRSLHLTLATAESCTGGNIAHTITEVAGCSDVYKGGVVSYCNEVKMNVLGVDEADLKREGAVSQPVVRQMAAGACHVCDADCAVSTSGIAGPGGAVPGKPVGTVWIAARTPDHTVERRFQFEGDRTDVIRKATEVALSLLSSLL